MGSSSVAFCVTGWHFNEAFYAALSKAPSAPLFVMSHRPPALVPPYVQTYLSGGRLFTEPNRGYDWGCYQQFLAKDIWKDFDYLVFIHDDITIKDLGFVERCQELLDAGHSVIGNGRQTTQWHTAVQTPNVYAHASWIPHPNFSHDNVRGSFFATTATALHRLGKFEVFWDPMQLSSGYGNWSTRASCAKWQFRLGPECFHFLSEQYRSSEFLEEMERGGTLGEQFPAQTRSKKATMFVIQAICAHYTRAYWKQRNSLAQRALASTLRPAVALLSGTARQN